MIALKTHKYLYITATCNIIGFPLLAGLSVSQGLIQQTKNPHIPTILHELISLTNPIFYTWQCREHAHRLMLRNACHSDHGTVEDFEMRNNEINKLVGYDEKTKNEKLISAVFLHVRFAAGDEKYRHIRHCQKNLNNQLN